MAAEVNPLRRQMGDCRRLHQRGRQAGIRIPRGHPTNEIGDNENFGPEVVDLQYLPCIVGKVLKAVIEANEHGPANEWMLVCNEPNKLFRTNAMIAMMAKPRHLRVKHLPRDAITRQLRNALIRNTMIHQYRYPVMLLGYGKV